MNGALLTPASWHPSWVTQHILAHAARCLITHCSAPLFPSLQFALLPFPRPLPPHIISALFAAPASFFPHPDSLASSSVGRWLDMTCRRTRGLHAQLPSCIRNSKPWPRHSALDSLCRGERREEGKRGEERGEREEGRGEGGTSGLSTRLL